MGSTYTPKNTLFKVAVMKKMCFLLLLFLSIVFFSFNVGSAKHERESVVIYIYILNLPLADLVLNINIVFHLLWKINCV